MVINPSNGLSSSRIKTIAAETESALTSKTVITVGLRGAKSPKLAKRKVEPGDHHHQKGARDHARVLDGQLPARLSKVSAHLQRPGLQPALRFALRLESSKLVLKGFEQFQGGRIVQDGLARSVLGQVKSILRVV